MELGFLVLNGVVCQDYLPRTETHQITQFANCGCKDACNCVVSNGDTTTVTGSGSAVDPYIVEVKPNTASITVEDTDCIDLNGSGTPTDPVNATLIISPDADNLLVRPASGCTANGLKISCNDVTDCITVGDCLEIVGGVLNTKIAPDVDGGNGIECTPDGLLVAPSSDTDNSIVYGSDGNLYVPQGECVAVPMEVEIDLTGGSSCLSATGGGCVGDPYVLTLGLAADPNGLDCVATGLQVIPSTDAGNSMIFGTDGRLFTPTPFVEVLDTSTVDMTLTGTGTSGDPFVLSACAPAVVASNTSCITLTVLKGGVGCEFPYVLSADPVIDPDPCNILECRPTGMFVPGSDVPLPMQALVSEFAPAGNYGPFNGNIGETVFTGPFCLSIDNPSACKTMRVDSVLRGYVGVARDSGNFRFVKQISFTGPAGPWVSVGGFGIADPSGPTHLEADYVWEGDQFDVLPGATLEICFRFLAMSPGNNVVNGSFETFDYTFKLKPSGWTT